MGNQKSDEWGTPESIFNLLPSGGYYDPCPGPNQPIEFNRSNGNITVWRNQYYQDALDLENLWEGYNFVNPPFSNIEAFIIKAIQLHKDFGKWSVIVMPDHTDCKWYRRTVQPSYFPVVWIGRHKFIPMQNQKVSSPAFGTGLMFVGYSNIIVNQVIQSVKPD